MCESLCGSLCVGVSVWEPPPISSLLIHSSGFADYCLTYSEGRLWAIDWEYCAMGSPWYDIAVVVNGDSLNAAQTDALLTAYLGRPATQAQRLTLRQYGCI